jgi:hypothetical protein
MIFTTRNEHNINSWDSDDVEDNVRSSPIFRPEVEHNLHKDYPDGTCRIEVIIRSKAKHNVWICILELFKQE